MEHKGKHETNSYYSQSNSLGNEVGEERVNSEKKEAGGKVKEREKVRVSKRDKDRQADKGRDKDRVRKRK